MNDIVSVSKSRWQAFWELCEIMRDEMMFAEGMARMMEGFFGSPVRIRGAFIAWGKKMNE